MMNDGLSVVVELRLRVQGAPYTNQGDGLRYTLSGLK
jgi:hypothetical protein